MNTPVRTPEPELHVTVAARTDVGRVRPLNEDSYVVADLTADTTADPSGGKSTFDVGERGVLLAVADGMGGAQAGEVASSLVVETVRRSLDKAIASGLSGAAALETAVQSAHRVVWNTSQAQNQTGPTRMGATLTAAYVSNGVATIAEVGDSRAYLLRAGELTMLTHDQSLVQSLLDAGTLTPAEANESSMKNIILQAMGHQPMLHVALARLELRDRDCLLLCSDGLTSLVTDPEIRDTVLRAPTLESAAQELVSLALSRGGTDNVTVILAGIGGHLMPPSAEERVESTFAVIQEFTPKSTRSSRA